MFNASRNKPGLEAPIADKKGWVILPASSRPATVNTDVFVQPEGILMDVFCLSFREKAGHKLLTTWRSDVTDTQKHKERYILWATAL